MLATAKCRRRSRLRTRYRARARCDDEPAHRKRTRLGRLGLHGPSRCNRRIRPPLGRRRPNRHRPSPWFRHRNGGYDDPQRRDRLDWVHPLGCIDRARRPTDPSAAADSDTRPDRDPLGRGEALGVDGSGREWRAAFGRAAFNRAGIGCSNRERLQRTSLERFAIDRLADRAEIDGAAGDDQIDVSRAPREPLNHSPHRVAR